MIIDSPSDKSMAMKKYPSGEKLSKRMVAYLDDHMLPPPHQTGTIRINIFKKGETEIKWQDHKSVYQLTSKKDPMDVLKMVVSVKSFS